MNREVEIFKIGSILPNIISKNDINEGKREGKDTIMFVFNGGPIFDYYVDILKKECGDTYKYLRTDKTIVGTPDNFKSSLLGYKRKDSIKGIHIEDPKVGQIYEFFSVNIGYWQTSSVVKVVTEDIFITKNSVYAIHDTSKLRDKKLNDLGIN